MNNNQENNQELNRLTEQIISCVEQHVDQVPKGFLLFHKKEIRTLKDALIFLELIFKVEEDEIESLRLRQSSTVDYENNVREFAVAINSLLYPKHEILKGDSAYLSLLTRKYMAYAFFHGLNRNLSLQEIREFPFSRFYERLYQGLVEFYEKFYGRFSDNEEAIELLCKFFPVGIDAEEYKTEIASALYIHASNAGTPEDRGYAFRGIAQIEKYIGNLPDEIVMELLGRYQVNLIINNEVFRHQVYTIIDYAQKNTRDKQVCKFLCLDSVLLVWQIGKYLAEELINKNPNAGPISMLFEENYIMGKIKVCESLNAFWDYKSSSEEAERVFYIDEIPILTIELGNRENIEISRIDDRGNKKFLELPYKYSDWLLESYFSKEVEQKLRKLILGFESKYNQMYFSLLYLEHYRGMNNRTIDFDHKFQYDKKYQRLQRQTESAYQIGSFYGQSVRTLSCIVGKNGTGKTSIIDFLRESFFKLLRLIEDYGILCINGYIDEDNYREYNILDEGAKFLVVFQVGVQSFFLTNISKVESEGAEPFTAGLYNSINEFSKVAYFSNMLKSNQESIFLEENTGTGNGREETKREIGRSLRGFRQVDYSETESFIRRQKAIIFELGRKQDKDEDRTASKGSINRELCYQLTFLKNMHADKVCGYLDIDEKKKFKISSRMNGLAEEEFALQDLQDSDRLYQIEKKYLFLPDAQLQYFSSGQYAKFAFLAKLYWFLEGYGAEIERYRSIVGENEFRSEDALLEGETALIFIDEGETYYHPEWQRRYMKTLLEMVNDNKKGFRIQIVITTNSPFILSDILKEDVTYLAEENKGQFDRTLGQNIHSLLKENFFMDYTIGEYARELIENIMLCLKSSDDEEQKSRKERIQNIILRYYGEEKEAYPAIQLLIGQIGEPVYRYELEKLLDDSYLMKEYRTKERLLEEKRRIEEEIQALEEKG